MRVNVMMGAQGATYPHSSEVYRRLWKERLARWGKLKSLHAPRVIIEAEEELVREAAIGVDYPEVVNQSRREGAQFFHDRLCREVTGDTWCKRPHGHDGMCEPDWWKAADLV